MAFHLQRFKTRISKQFFKTIFETRVFFEPHDMVEKFPRSEIISHLKNNNKVKVVESNEEECDVKVVFCPIVSRAGTDIDAALSRRAHEKPTMMIVLHHTFDPEHIAPSSSSWDIENMMMVDVLFYEDSGLLICSKNNETIKRAEHYLLKFSQPQLVVNKLAVISAGLIVSAGVFALKKCDKLQKKIIYLYLYFKWMWHFNMFSWRENTNSDEF